MPQHDAHLGPSRRRFLWKASCARAFPGIIKVARNDRGQLAGCRSLFLRPKAGCRPTVFDRRRVRPARMPTTTSRRREWLKAVPERVLMMAQTTTYARARPRTSATTTQAIVDSNGLLLNQIIASNTERHNLRATTICARPRTAPTPRTTTPPRRRILEAILYMLRYHLSGCSPPPRAPLQANMSTMEVLSLDSEAINRA